MTVTMDDINQITRRIIRDAVTAGDEFTDGKAAAGRQALKRARDRLNFLIQELS